MVLSPIGRWALWGMAPAGRYLLERRQVCAEFPLVVAGDGQLTASRNPGLPWTTDWSSLLADPLLDGIVLTVPLSERASRIKAALAAGKSVLVEGCPCRDDAELAELEAAIARTDRRVGVFSARPVESDFYLARTSVQSGRLGILHRVSFIACEFALPHPERDDDEPAVLLLQQFLELTDESPDEVQAWIVTESAGIQLRLTCASGLTAWLEVHRRSLCGLRTGWVVEGSQGAYRQGRLMTLAGDGELREEPVAKPACADDIWLQLTRLAERPEAGRESWRLTAQVIRLFELCRKSIESHLPIRYAEPL